MIYSASRRTDLVAFYPEYICQKVSRSRKLEAIVFWTKDPRNIHFHQGLRSVIARYPSILQFTLTGLGGSWWEPGVPAPELLEESLFFLAKELPAGAVRWRFDPIIVDASLQDRFVRMLDMLRKCGLKIEEVVVSFPDPYAKVVRRLSVQGKKLPETTLEGKKEILGNLHAISGLPLSLCCEHELLTVTGTRQGCCIDSALFDRLYGTNFGKLKKDSGQRKDCGCCISTDIGSYEQQCRHNCRYCYANPATE